MADFDFLKYFKTPDLVTPLSVGLEMGERHRNAETQRMFAENQARRQSAQDAREQQEFEEKRADRERKDKIEQAHVFGTLGSLAYTNPAAAQVLGEAYGIHLQHPLLAATAAAAQEQTPDQQFDQALSGSPPSGGEKEVEMPAGENAVGPSAHEDELEGLMQKATPPPSPGASFRSSSPVAQASAEEMPPSNPLWEAVIGGQHYALPKAQQGTGLGEKYDRLYNNAIGAGFDEAKARELTFKMFEKDNEAQNIADRTAQSIIDRETQKEKFGHEFTPTAEQRQENFTTLEKGRNARNAANNKARLDTAALMGGPRKEQADTGKRTQYMGVVKDYVNRVGANKDIAVLKNLAKIKGELGPNASASTQQAAADTLASIAQQGKPSQTIMNAFNNHALGPVQQAEDKVYQTLNNGRHSPAWVESHNETVRELRKTYDELTRNEADAFEDAAGNRSAYASDPEVGPHVQEQRRTFYKTMGVPLPKEGPSDEDQLGEILKQLRTMK